MEVGEINLRFEPGEFYALTQIARKYGTDLGSILRIGGKLVIEADRRGLLKITDPRLTVQATMPKEDA